MAITDDISRSTTRIENTESNGSISTGTGFFWRFSEHPGDFWVVTNRHVLAEHKTLSVTFDLQLAPPKENVKSIIVTNENPNVIEHPDPTVDLAAIWLVPFAQSEINGTRPRIACITRENLITEDFLNDLTAVEPVLMVGYPNGLYDEANNKPIVRSGITATAAYRKYMGKRQFMIDCACYPGSSGSPVYIYRSNPWKSRSTGQLRMGVPPEAFAGVLFSGPFINQKGEIQRFDGSPTDDKINVQSMMHLGHVIDAREILEMEDLAKDLIREKWRSSGLEQN
jgi:hypothetical protein|tara:strand:+ start:374 stop:1219 length:846 start_codon:yes stop_codon:yes gene_type:complete